MMVGAGDVRSIPVEGTNEFTDEENSSFPEHTDVLGGQSCQGPTSLVNRQDPTVPTTFIE